MGVPSGSVPPPPKTQSHIPAPPPHLLKPAKPAMRYVLRLRFVNDLGDGMTDIPVDSHVGQLLIEAGCTSFAVGAPYSKVLDTTYVEVYTGSYVDGYAEWLENTNISIKNLRSQHA